MSQLALNLPHRPALEREDFLVAPSNELAVAWIDRWPDWPGPGLALHGPPGAGKSHLLQVWRAASGAIEIEATALADVEPAEILGRSRSCALDGLDEVLAAAPDFERKVFHIHNMIAERGGHLLITGVSAPARWPVELADLRSRLSAIQAVAIEAPDDALLEAILVKLFLDRQLRVSGDVVRYLVPRIERSFDAIRSLVDDIDRAALSAHRAITIPLVRGVLDQRASQEATLTDQG